MSAIEFQYKAVDRAGATRSGAARGATEADIYRQLTSQGLLPLKITVARARRTGRQCIKPKDLAHFTSQLSVLVQARVPISDGLISIAEQESEPRLKAIITDVAARIESGEPIAQAMGNHSEVFGEIYIQTVRAAEASGTLTRVLDHLAEMLERSAETQRQVKGALMYPICVLVVLAIAVTFLLGFVVPKFADMFASRGVDLPSITRWLMHVGHSMQHYWFVYIGAVAGAIFAYKRVNRTKKGREALDRVWHKVPFVKNLLKGLAISRFCHVLGISLGAGLSLIDSLEMAGKAAGRGLLMRDAMRMADRVRGGGRLSEVMTECGYMTPFAKRMISAGETSGELPKMCGAAARHYDRETQHLAKNIGTVIEPVMVMLIAGVVLVIALAIFLPMWNMVSLMG